MFVTQPSRSENSLHVFGNIFAYLVFHYLLL